MSWIKSILISVCCFFSTAVISADLSNIKVYNGQNLATVKFTFYEHPVYSFFVRYNLCLIELDINKKNTIIKGLPINFTNNNIVQRIYTKTKNKQRIYLIIKLAQSSQIQSMLRHVGNQYHIIFIIRRLQSILLNSKEIIKTNLSHNIDLYNKFHANHINTVNKFMTINHAIPNNIVIVAIDAGHGGQDPGASSQHGLYEKTITMTIARQLKKLMDQDPMFKAVLTRTGDYFISVKGRSEIARKEKANLLVSIHADSAQNHLATGASVWILSNRRANSELANWLEQKEKQSELLGGASDLLVNKQLDPYLSQVVLDLQFCHSQHVGYDVAMKILQQLRIVMPLHKRLPEYASLGVLRSPDIPSLLIETGFISNLQEEQLLKNKSYQKIIAKSIYKGLHNYFLQHPLQSSVSKKKKSLTNSISKRTMHFVRYGDTFSSIAKNTL